MRHELFSLLELAGCNPKRCKISSTRVGRIEMPISSGCATNFSLYSNWLAAIRSAARFRRRGSAGLRCRLVRDAPRTFLFTRTGWLQSEALQDFVDAGRQD